MEGLDDDPPNCRCHRSRRPLRNRRWLACVLLWAVEPNGKQQRIYLTPSEAGMLGDKMVQLAQRAEGMRIEKENVRAEVRAARERAVGPELVEAVRQFITAVKHPMAAETNHWVGCPGPLFSKMADLVRDVDAETGT